MKTTGRILALTVMLILLIHAAPCLLAGAAGIYTDFAGTEFDEGSNIAKGTVLKIEILNEEKTEISGELFYAFYDKNGQLIGVEPGAAVALGAEEETKSVSYTVENAYTEAGSLKILLWEAGGSVRPLAANITARKATGADGPSTQYKNFGEQPQDKLAEQMPVPFDVNNYMTEIASADFAEGLLGDFTEGDVTGECAPAETGGTDDSACIKAVHTKESITQYRMVFKDTAANMGDYYMLRCKMKGEGLTEAGTVRSLLQVYDSTGNKWLAETGTTINTAVENDGEWVVENDGQWVDCEKLLMIPEIANNIEGEEKYYTIRVGLYVTDDAEDCTVYLDDVELHKVIFEPMDTVLVTPNYKGLIYGDGKTADINLRVNINDYNGGSDLSEFTFKSRIVDSENNALAASETDTVTKVMDVTFSSAGLSMGEDYYLQAILLKNGEVFQKQEWTLRKREEGYRPDIYVDEHNRFVKNGEVMLPLFQYAHGNIYEEYVDITEGTSVDAFTVAGAYHTAYRSPRMQRLRSAMSEKNIGGLLEMCGYVYSNLYTGIPKTNVKKQSDIRSLLTVMCNNFKDDPRIWGYRVFDEQNATRYGEELRWQNDIMASVDINHPTLGVTDNVISDRPGIYAKTADIIGVDPYFCTGEDTQDLSRVGEMVREFKELNPNKPVFAIIQGFWFEKRGDQRGPTEQEYRNMAWQVLCEGITVLDSYCYTDVKELPWGDQTPEEIWQGQMEVLSEIEEFENVLLSVEPASAYEVSGEGEWLTSSSRRYDGKSYFIAVNTENNTNLLKIKADGVAGAREYFSGTEITPDAEGYLNFDMDAYGVAILEVEQPDYLSPHCELIRFSVSDCVITDADKENPVIQTPDGVNELRCKAYTSDHARVYINGAELAENGMLNIENLTQITVRVESQDGNNISEKTYLLSK